LQSILGCFPLRLADGALPAYRQVSFFDPDLEYFFLKKMHDLFTRSNKKSFSLNEPSILEHRLVKESKNLFHEIKVYHHLDNPVIQ
jgi:hypothetical protein